MKSIWDHIESKQLFTSLHHSPSRCQTKIKIRSKPVHKFFTYEEVKVSE